MYVCVTMKVLIVYATRYGATAGTTEEIAKILREEGFEVRVVNAKEEKVKDISEYELVVVGSGIQMGKWTSAADGFLSRFHRELSQKKLALFVSSMKTMSEREGRTDDLTKSRKTTLDDKVAKYNLHPIALGFFGGVIDYNKMNFLFRRTMGFLKPQLEKDDFKELRPGVYDLRNWDEIRSWARELAAKARLQ
jgi:menaquinone-dependent protoporphyrinogen oxidase